MSARAAWRLESLGFTAVYRYTAGKADWIANGLPTAGELAAVPTVGDLARRDAPTCRLDEPIGAVRARVKAAGWDMCLVVNQERVVLGRLRTRELAGDPNTPAERVMLAGPGTIRLNQSAAETAADLEQKELRRAIVSTSDGVLVGVFYREDVARPG